MHTMAPSCFCCIQIQDGWLGIDYNILQVDQKTWMERLPTIHLQEKCKQWRSVVALILGGFLSSQRALVVP